MPPFPSFHYCCVEPEAVDLLLEVDQLDQLEGYVDDKNFGRTCLYLVSCCNYLPEPEDTQVGGGVRKVVCFASSRLCRDSRKCATRSVPLEVSLMLVFWGCILEMPAGPSQTCTAHTHHWL